MLVTGAASGIGRAFAVSLAAQGASLVLVDVDAARLDETVSTIRSAGGAVSLRTMATDIGSAADVRQMAEELGSHFESLDLLVNCAAILGPGAFAEQSLADFAKVIQVDVLGTVHMIHATLPWLRRARGHVVNLASTASLHGWPLLSAYSAAKGAIENFSEAVRPELARDGVGLTAVFPLLVDTPLLQRGGLPPILRGRRISAERVVSETPRAVERRRPRLYIPWSARLVAVVHGLAPGLLDFWGARFGMPRR